MSKVSIHFLKHVCIENGKNYAPTPSTWPSLWIHSWHLCSIAWTTWLSPENFSTHQLHCWYGFASQQDLLEGLCKLCFLGIPKEKVTWGKIRWAWGPFHIMMQGNDALTKQFSQTLTNCNQTMCRGAILYPPQMSECSRSWPREVVLELRYHIVVDHMQTIQTIDISLEEEWPNYLTIATKSDPNG